MLARRDLFSLAGRAGLVALCAALVGCGDDGGSREDGRQDSIPPDAVAAVVAVGRAYLKMDPGAADADSLRQRLGLDTGRSQGIGFTGVLEVAARDDFWARRVVLVDGWMLSHTEVQLAALVALERPDDRAR